MVASIAAHRRAVSLFCILSSSIGLWAGIIAAARVTLPGVAL
ncbi:hypothetical protein [Sphingomonas abietis]|uniref:Uncharacterized protein n=1 Tax=Sphingomonas abietis TaxID=3012344 RepID=A0ABY7NSK6_9SPHN|nr:hypothetical protein [Sphingomonas abietis]WBO23557.1 hypothetical protein PBT88_05355 [Sphingomonas abietis]